MKKEVGGEGRGGGGPSRISPRPEVNVREVMRDPSVRTVGSQMSNASANTTVGLKKSRKPYTITKNRENWTPEEHERFVEALNLYKRDWKQIETHIGSKSVIQIRSHAQKYFLKCQKNNTADHVPPPRKRRNNKNAVKSVGHGETVQSNHQGQRLVMQIPQTVMSSNVMQIQPQQVYTNDFVNSPSLSVMPPNQGSLRAVPKQENGIMNVPGSYEMNDVMMGDGNMRAMPNMEQNAMFTRADRTNGAPVAISPEDRPDPQRMNFARIYEFFSLLFDPTQSISELEKHVERTFNVLDCEIIKLLAQNLEANLSNSEFRKMLLQTHG